MNVGILVICTGKYDIFFEELYRSCERLFLKDATKTYYVFTDKKIMEAKNIVSIFQQKLGWPFDTMMRFKMFLAVKDQLLNEDYLYFLNSNIKVVKDIGSEIVPEKEHGYLMGAIHPGFGHSDVNAYTYDRNSKCSCYIPYNQGRFYVAGGFCGGRSPEFLEMSRKLNQNIEKDLLHGIIPVWHDESQLNWYYNQQSPLLVPHGYFYPENWQRNLVENAKIWILDKDRYGGHSFLRN